MTLLFRLRRQIRAPLLFFLKGTRPHPIGASTLGMVFPAKAADGVAKYLRENVHLHKGTDELLNQMAGGVNRGESSAAVTDADNLYTQYITLPCLVEHVGIKSTAPGERDKIRGGKWVERDTLTNREQYRLTFKRASLFEGYPLDELRAETELLRKSPSPAEL